MAHWLLWDPPNRRGDFPQRGHWGGAEGEVCREVQGCSSHHERLLGNWANVVYGNKLSIYNVQFLADTRYMVLNKFCRAELVICILKLVLTSLSQSGIWHPERREAEEMDKMSHSCRIWVISRGKGAFSLFQIQGWTRTDDRGNYRDTVNISNNPRTRRPAPSTSRRGKGCLERLPELRATQSR